MAMMEPSLRLLILASTVAVASASCFGNSTVPNTTSPCLTGGYLSREPHLSPYRPFSPYHPPAYHHQEHIGFRPPHQQSPQNAYLPHVPSPVSVGQNGIPLSFYRPGDIGRIGYSYPPDYRGPFPQWPQYEYNNHLSQPPPRYTIPYGHSGLSPVAPEFQRRTYLADHRLNKVREPIFMDKGTVTPVGRDVELSCAFTDPRFRIVSNVAWVKVTGPYDQMSQYPPFECRRLGCNYLYINGLNDFRFRVITLGQTSTLRIYDYIAPDQGIYRCAATAEAPDGQTVTVYKITELFARMSSHRPYYDG